MESKKRSPAGTGAVREGEREMRFPILSEEERIRRLAPPKGKVHVVIDTDTYNEVDDQFALAYAQMSPEQMQVDAVYAAPFSSGFFAKLLHTGVDIPMTDNLQEGLELSYKEILNLYGLLELDTAGKVFKGSAEYMTKPGEYVDSDAARDLAARARASEDILYVVAIGEITNVASAILMDPEIIKKIVIVWLAGQPLHWPTAIEFNLGQDVLASQVILDCGVPLVVVPCMSVASNLTVTAPELETHLKGKSKVGTYLSDIVISQLTQEMGLNWLGLFHQTYCRGLDDYGENGVPSTTTMLSPSRIIWDISTIAYMCNPAWCPSTLAATPYLTQDYKWRIDEKRHKMRICNYIYRDAVFGDMFYKLAKAPK